MAVHCYSQHVIKIKTLINNSLKLFKKKKKKVPLSFKKSSNPVFPEQAEKYFLNIINILVTKCKGDQSITLGIRFKLLPSLANAHKSHTTTKKAVNQLQKQ